MSIGPSAGFIECDRVGVPLGYPCQEILPIGASWQAGIINFNTSTPDSQDDPAAPANTWLTSPVIPNIPDDTLAVDLGGVLIITAPNAGYLADIQVFFRGSSSVMPTPPQTRIDFPLQATLQGFGGVRNPAYVTVPVVNRTFSWWWARSTARGTGTPTYGCKMYVQKYYRKSTP